MNIREFLHTTLMNLALHTRKHNFALGYMVLYEQHGQPWGRSKNSGRGLYKGMGVRFADLSHFS